MDIRPIDANALSQHKKMLVEHMDGYDVAYNAVPIHKVDELPTLSLNTLRDVIYEDAVAHGLWDWAQTYEHPSASDFRSECAQLVWDEALELDEAYKCEEDYAEELADCVIVAMSIAGKLGIDIDAAIRRKMEINKGRAWKHGKE